MTSHDVVGGIRRLFCTKKVGHTGTLDPNATGVLPVLVGNAVKASDLLPETGKVYRAEVRFGAAFDTEDVWGKPVKTNDLRPDRASFEAACRALTGEILQTPPMISAVKIRGKKLYEYARQGVEVEREPRRVTVSSVKLLSFSENGAALRIACSKGTYIRTLLVDICARCGVLGAMSALCREESGGFSLENAVTLAGLEDLTVPQRESLLIPAEQLFSRYPAVYLPSFFDKLVFNGLVVAQSKLKTDHPAGQRLRLYRDGAFFALGEAVEENGVLSLKKIKDFPPDDAN